MPIYTAYNCSVAYQLDWSYSLFWNAPPSHAEWFTSLRDACEPDGIRILQHHFETATVSQFLISTLPSVTPLKIAQRVKGRLQHLIRGEVPKAFRRNFSLRSIGSTRRTKLDEYLATQLQHHRYSHSSVAEELAAFQIHHSEIDLSQPIHSAHAIYWYNLHAVFVNHGRWPNWQAGGLRTLSAKIETRASQQRHRLSRGAVLPDHVHLALGANLDESPEEVVLGYMNSIVEANSWGELFRRSYYVAGFSEYDIGVIPRVVQNHPLH